MNRSIDEIIDEFYDPNSWKNPKCKNNNIEKSALLFFELMIPLNQSIYCDSNLETLEKLFKQYEDNIQFWSTVEKGDFNENQKMFEFIQTHFISDNRKYFKYVFNSDILNLLKTMLECFKSLSHKYLHSFQKANHDNDKLMKNLTKISRYFFLYIDKLLQYPRDLKYSVVRNISKNTNTFKIKFAKYITFKLKSFKIWRKGLKNFLIVNVLNESEIDHAIWGVKEKDVIYNLYTNPKYKSKRHVFLNPIVRQVNIEMFESLLYENLGKTIKKVILSTGLKCADRLYCIVFIYFFILWITENVPNYEEFVQKNFYPYFKYINYKRERLRRDPMIFEYGKNEYLCNFDQFLYIGNVFQVLYKCSTFIKLKNGSFFDYEDIKDVEANTNKEEEEEEEDVQVEIPVEDIIVEGCGKYVTFS